ncbi:hypothetical protein AVEN_240236-1 [Araneus ventricosus]|uniref:RNase H type-1 domain-containing protein n=1 Tax=Araneus ventricosus TaxID=182803 RepID=A0A4Y2PHB9_ARAVE|nr:hypothetical protein AVEN_240236-1 [Araneus ventricosus]
MVFNPSTYKSNKKQLMPELLEQDLHPTFSPLYSAQQISRAKAVEFIFTPPPYFLLHSQISFAENHIDSGVKAMYTDGSKTDEGTGSAYCILENYEILASCRGKLDRSNLVFQAEILAIRMAIEAASSLHRPIKIWTDSLSSLMAIFNPKSHHSIVRDIKTLLLSHKYIHLRWLKTHVGYLGNKCADQLAKEAITKGDPFLLPKPLSYLKAEIKSAPLSIWQDNWDNGETGRSTHDIVPRVSNKPVGWNREEITFVTGHGPFPSYLFASIFEHMTTARAEKKEIQFTMPQNVRLPSPGISKLQQCHSN